MSDVRIVLVTAPAGDAERLARGLVEARLAACVGMLPGLRSVYRWNGAIETSDEVQLVVKTAAPIDGVKAWIEREHPYEVPEILLLAVDDASAKYAAWVEESTKG